MVGFASDGASVMFGAKNGVAAKFQKEIPGLFVLKCICHSLARAASYASAKLPPAYEGLLSDVYNYLKLSSKRQQSLQNLRTKMELPDRKVQKVYQIRWLSMESAVNVFLDQYEALKTFFDQERKIADNPKKIEADRIYQMLQSPWTRMYLEFLKYALGLVCRKNQEFQAQEPKIHQLYEKMEYLFKTVVKSFMDENDVDMYDPQYVDFKNEKLWLPVREIYLGAVVNAKLRALPPTVSVAHIDSFRTSCRTFMLTLAEQIYQRFPFGEPSVQLLKEFDFLDPEKIMKKRCLGMLPIFFNVDPEELQEEFRQFKTLMKIHTDMESSTFWTKVCDTKAHDGTLIFPKMKTIYSKVCVLPHTSSNCERIFSDINRNKTKGRSQLDANTISGILYAKRLTKKKQFKVWNVDYKPMMKYFNKDMYVNEK